MPKKPSVSDLAQALSWAMDLIDMYDKRLCQLGEPEQLVYSEKHMHGKAMARNMISDAVLGDEAEGDGR